MGGANPYRSDRERKQSCSFPGKAANVMGAKQVLDVLKSLSLSVCVDEGDRYFRPDQAAVNHPFRSKYPSRMLML